MEVSSGLRQEWGITRTVQTTFSQYTIYDILTLVGQKKGEAVSAWLDTRGLFPRRTLIFGSYLTGAAVARFLLPGSEVLIHDIHPQVQSLVPSGAGFTTHPEELTGTWDCIVETTGLGGISAAFLERFSARSFIVEDPCSDGSDACIRNKSQCIRLAEKFNAPDRGVLFSTGLIAKTSGTMTLTIEIIRRSMSDVLGREGVLYCSASLDFFERILFQERDPTRFFTLLDRPALIVSSLCPVDPDEVIGRNLDSLLSVVRNPGEG